MKNIIQTCILVVLLNAFSVSQAYDCELYVPNEFTDEEVFLPTTAPGKLLLANVGKNYSLNSFKPSCGFLGVTAELGNRKDARAFPNLHAIESNETKSWFFATTHSASYLRVVEVVISLHNQSLYAHVPSAWYTDKGDLPDTEGLTVDHVNAQYSSRTNMSSVSTSDGSGYGLDQMVYTVNRYPIRPSNFIFNTPTKHRYSEEELDSFVELARQRFREWFTNTTITQDMNHIDEGLYADLQNDLNHVSDERTDSIDENREDLTAEGCCNSTQAFDFMIKSDGNAVKDILRVYLQKLAKAHANLPFGEEKTSLGDYIVSAFKNLGERGINGTHFDPQFKDEWDEWGQFGFPASSDFPGRNAFNRLEGALSMATLLMQKELDESNQLHYPLGALRFFTEQWEASKQLLETYHGKRNGMNSDIGRILLTSRLRYLLSLPNETIDNGNSTRADELDTWWAFVERLCSITNTVEGSFKPDGTMNHHMKSYLNGYPIFLIPYIAEAAYILRDTPWAISNQTLTNTAKAAALIGVYTANGSGARSVGGRLINNDDQVLNIRRLCANLILSQSYLPLSSQWRDILGGIALRAMEYSFNDIRDAEPGCIRLWYNVVNSNFSVPNKVQDKFGKGAYIFPHAGMATFSASGSLQRKDFVILAKGFSHVVKDNFEAQVTTNVHGDYQSAGSLLPLFRNKDNIELFPYSSGRDWFRFPGTTTPHRTSTCDSIAERELEWATSPNAFVGGTVDLDGAFGAWGFNMEDLHANSSAEENRLVASKSLFFIAGDTGNPYILAMGTNITESISPEAGNHTIETTIFQNYIPETLTYSIVINDENYTDIEFDSTTSLPDLNTTLFPVHLMDSNGISYVVVDGNLKIKSGVQTSHPSNCDPDKEKGNWSVAYLDHGASPLGSKYEYVIILNLSQSGSTFHPEEQYEILSKSSSVHACRCKHSGRSKYFIYETSGKSLTLKIFMIKSVGIVAFIADGSDMPEKVKAATNIIHVSKACAVTTKFENQTLAMTVANPELGFTYDGNSFNDGYTRDKRRMYQRQTKPQEVNLVLSGQYEVVNFTEIENTMVGPSGRDNSGLLQLDVQTHYSESENTTSVKVVNQNGIPMSIKLKVIATEVVSPSVSPTVTPSSSNTPSSSPIQQHILSPTINTPSTSPMHQTPSSSPIQQHILSPTINTPSTSPTHQLIPSPTVEINFANKQAGLNMFCIYVAVVVYVYFGTVLT